MTEPLSAGSAGSPPDEALREMMIADDAHPDADVSMRNEAGRGRYVIEVDGTAAGFAAYELGDDRIVFTHTVIESEYEGKGFGSRLARFALDDVAHGDGVIVVPRCPFIAAWIDKHPDYEYLKEEKR